jgi:formate/nitrite transporter FocA (FNT family)
MSFLKYLFSGFRAVATIALLANLGIVFYHATTGEPGEALWGGLAFFIGVLTVYIFGSHLNWKKL